MSFSLMLQVSFLGITDSGLFKTKLLLGEFGRKPNGWELKATDMMLFTWTRMKMVKFVIRELWPRGRLIEELNESYVLKYRKVEGWI